MINNILEKSQQLHKIKKEEKLVRKEYKKLKEVIASRMTEEEEQSVDRAFELAWEGHKGVYRHSGEAYIIHSLRTAYILAKEIELGITSILSGILHDVVEDTSVSINKVKEIFGPEVSKIVYGVTKVKKIFEWGQSVQAENFKKLLLSITRDHRVILVKLADRLDNMRTLGALPRRKQLRIASETITIYVPLAHRIGLNNIKIELEDLYLKHIYPNVYNRINKELRATRRTRERQIDRFLAPIIEVLEKKGIKFRIKKRAKSIYAIWKKMERKQISINQIYDLIAARIIVECPIDQEKMVCWQVLGIVCSMYVPNLHRFRDWVSRPKSNGYSSLHTTVMNTNGQWVEVQIRTRRMEEVAFKGLAAHWRYKEDRPLAAMPLLDMWMKNIQQVLKEQKESTIEAMEDVRIGLLEEEIIVFNRRGKIGILPRGATVLDFAIEEKGMEGLKCSSALVNKKLVPLNYKLNNDDQIECILNKAQVSEREWLNFLVTPKARRIVKKVLKATYETLQQRGKAMVRARLSELESSLNKETEELMREFFDEKTISAVYYRIGKEQIKFKELTTFANFIKSVKKDTLIWGGNPHKVYVDSAIKQSGIMLKNEQKQNYRLARCCEPIVGEEIFGVVGLRKAIKIHRIDCPNALYILTHQGDKVVKADWGEKERGMRLTLAIMTLNREDIRKNIISLLRKQCNIASAFFKEQQGYMKGELSIEVKNVSQLTNIISQVQSVQGVISTQRYTQA